MGELELVVIIAAFVITGLLGDLVLELRRIHRKLDSMDRYLEHTEGYLDRIHDLVYNIENRTAVR